MNAIDISEISTLSICIMIAALIMLMGSDDRGGYS